MEKVDVPFIVAEIYKWVADEEPDLSAYISEEFIKKSYKYAILDEQRQISICLKTYKLLQDIQKNGTK